MENIRCRAGAWLYDWMPVVLSAGLIFWLSSLSHPKVPSFHFSDKVYHLLLYGVFGYLLIRAFRPRERGWSRRRVVLTSCLGALLYGAIDEAHQHFIPHRSSDWKDLAVDGLAGVLGGFVFLLENYVRRGRGR